MTHPVDQVSFGAIVAVRDRLLEQQAAGRTIFRLESGDPSFDAPPHVRDAIVTALNKGHTHYTASTGIAPLREAILAKVRESNGLPVDNAEQVMVTNGGMHGLYLVFRCMLEPGDEVIIPDPMWTEIAENIRLAGGVTVRAPLLGENGPIYDAAHLEPLITPRTRAIFVNTPHNPTGVVLGRETLQGIVDLAARRNVRLISDEAYEHVIFDGLTHVSLGSLKGAEDRTITLFSTSKSYALSGLRVGYVVSRDAVVMERMKKLLRCTTNGVNSLAQHGVVAALRGPRDATAAMNKEYQHRRDLLWNGLQGLAAVTPIKPQGSFFMWLRINAAWAGYQGKKDDWAMTNALIDLGGVGSSPGTAFGPAGEACIRLAFSCDTGQVETAVGILRRLLA